MKKLYIILIAIIILIPFKIKAINTHIDKYYIDVTILDNGNVNVKELFVYKGSFNGAYKKISLENVASSDLFIDANLYTPDSINLTAIKDIPVDKNVNYNYINNSGTAYTRNDSATIGSSLLYLFTKENKTYTYKMFNPGSYKGFYIEYVLENSVITHKDISELWLNIFKQVEDDVNYLEIRVNFSKSNKNIKAWAHGSLNGNIEIKDNKAIFILNNMEKKESLDIRLAFDKINAKKTTNIEALDKIINYETKLADIANKERELARQKILEKENKEKQNAHLFFILASSWLGGLVILIFFIYRNYDKEYYSDFKGKYFRDIPKEENPVLVGYLMEKRIGNKELASVILNLINKKNITFEEQNQNDYLFSLNNINNLDEVEIQTIKLLFENENNIKLSQFKENAKNNHDSFLKNYNEWFNKANKLVNEKNYFEDRKTIKFYSILYVGLGLCLLFMYNNFVNKYMYFSVLVVSIIAIVYFLVYSRRTKEGNQEYLKWVGLKNFMNDFGKMDIKNLPEVYLWEKYLVYAVTLGCANRLIKVMKLKIDENTPDTNITNNILTITNINNIVTTSVNSAVSTAKSIAASNNSSGAGNGGGFSSGGFSGGGGGMTGHF